MFDNFNDLVTKIVEATKEKFGSHIIHSNPAAYLYNGGDNRSDLIQDFNSKSEFGILGYTIKDEVEIVMLNAEKKRFCHPYKERDVIIFPNNCTQDNIASVLAHELMHAMFKGISNHTDEGRGYDEACTDYLARIIVGKDYWTSYGDLLKNPTREKYLGYYEDFVKNMTDEQRTAILECCYGKTE